MNPIDILGSLLGQTQGRGGRGGDILGELMRGATRDSGSGSTTHTSLEQQAKELEDLLKVSKDRHSQPAPNTNWTPPASPKTTHAQSMDEQDKALILVRAMVNAAKADGRLDATEQKNIISRLNNPTKDTIEFLNREFERPLNVHEFALSVPVGMEQQVYTMSLIAIDLDTSDEAKYMMELAEGLRLSPEVREQIHQRLGAPSVY